MTRFLRERLRPISLQRGRCLDKSAEPSEDEAKVLRAVAGSAMGRANVGKTRQELLQLCRVRHPESWPRTFPTQTALRTD